MDISEETIMKPSLNVYEKIFSIIENNDASIKSVKKTLDEMKERQKQLKKIATKLQNSSLKHVNKPKITRKPCGFARPTEVSNEMCEFMGIDHNSLVSRTNVTKTLIKYIKDNNLQCPTNKRQIIPDQKLSNLFGDEAKDKELTYFNMQKYVNHHFHKKQ